MKNKIKEFLLGTSIIWMSILGSYIVELIFKMLGVD